MSEFSQRLKNFRLARGLNVKETARRIGVPMTTYREWEFGRAIQGQPYVKLAEVLGVSLGQLLTGAEPRAALHECLRELEQIEIQLRNVRNKIQGL